MFCYRKAYYYCHCQVHNCTALCEVHNCTALCASFFQTETHCCLLIGEILKADGDSVLNWASNKIDCIFIRASPFGACPEFCTSLKQHACQKYHLRHPFSFGCEGVSVILSFICDKTDTLKCIWAIEWSFSSYQPSWCRCTCRTCRTHFLWISWRLWHCIINFFITLPLVLRWHFLK